METTRHFTATVYVVHDGAVALHHHDRLDMWIAPGGHLDRDELPRAAARREVREETGLDVDLLEPAAGVGDDAESGVSVERGRELPPPEHVVLFDVDVYPDGEVGHQHVDHVYYGEVESRDIDPDGDDEADADEWAWFDREALRAEDLPSEVAELGLEAIEAVENRSG
jgi:ADP-ribose pyrophosphatase YjhB (NUDIX family)